MSLLPPLKKVGSPFIGSVKFSFAADGDYSGSIEVKDEAGGAFVVFHSDGKEGLAFDADELAAVAKWAKRLCDETTEFNAIGPKD